MMLFSDIQISQGSVATCLKRGGKFKHEFVANLLPSPLVKRKIENRIIFGEVIMAKSLVSCFFDSRCSVRLANTLSFLRGRCTGVYRVGNAHQDGRRQAVQRCPASPTRRHSSTSQSRGRISAARQPAAGYLPGVIVPRTSFIGGRISARVPLRASRPARWEAKLFIFISFARPPNSVSLSQATPLHQLRTHPLLLPLSLRISRFSLLLRNPRNPQDPVRLFISTSFAVAKLRLTLTANPATSSLHLSLIHI